MGEFLLAMAQERAEQAGVPAKSLVLRGVFREALAQVLKEHPEVTTLVLGAAIEGSRVTPVGYMGELVEWCHAEFGIEVIVVHEGETIEHLNS